MRVSQERVERLGRKMTRVRTTLEFYDYVFIAFSILGISSKGTPSRQLAVRIPTLQGSRHRQRRANC